MTRRGEWRRPLPTYPKFQHSRVNRTSANWLTLGRREVQPDPGPENFRDHADADHVPMPRAILGQNRLANDWQPVSDHRLMAERQRIWGPILAPF